MDIPDFFDFPPVVKVEHDNGHCSGGGGSSSSFPDGHHGLYYEYGQAFIHKNFKSESSPLLSSSASSGEPRLPPAYGSGSQQQQQHHASMGRLLNGQFPFLKRKLNEDGGGGDDVSSSSTNDKTRRLTIPEENYNFKLRTAGQLKEEVKMEGGGDVESLGNWSADHMESNSDSESMCSDDDKSSRKKRKAQDPSKKFSFSEKLKIYPGRYPCNFCPMVLAYAPALALHESQIHSQPMQALDFSQQHHHQVKGRYFCARCPFSVLRRKRYLSHHLREHLHLHVELEPPKKKLQPDKQQLHVAPVMNEASGTTKRHPCQSCNKRFHSLSNLWAHRRDSCELRHTFTWVATCPLGECQLKFESTADLDYHMTNTHSNNDRFNKSTNMIACEICGKQCVGQFGLHKHMEAHQAHSLEDANSPLMCQLCGETLKSRLYFNRHMKRHFAQGECHMCDQCGKTYDTKAKLGQHSEFHKDPSNWRFQCSECQRKCSTKQSLHVHMRTHTGEKPFICQVCGERYAYRHLLRAHVNQSHEQDGIQDLPRSYNKNSLGVGGTHQGRMKDPKNSEFTCDQCSKTFSTKQALQVHGRLHTGEKPFECPVCKERFRYRHFLRTHVNQKHQEEGIQDLARPYRKNGDETGTMPQKDGKAMALTQQDSKGVSQNGFACSQCSKVFSTKQAMQVHFRTHTGEKPFGCLVCGERFRYRHVLRSHVNTKHEQEGVRDVARPYNRRVNS